MQIPAGYWFISGDSDLTDLRAMVRRVSLLAANVHVASAIENALAASHAAVRDVEVYLGRSETARRHAVPLSRTCSLGQSGT